MIPRTQIGVSVRSETKQGRTERGGWGLQPPEIPKALQNHAKLNPIVKLLKSAEFRAPLPQDVQKKGSKILKQPRFYISNDK